MIRNRLAAMATEVLVRRRGSVALEYLLLATIVGIGIISGLACVRNALVAELKDLAQAIRVLL